MVRLMQKLAIDIPKFTFERRINVWLDNRKQVRAQGCTNEGTKFENFKAMACTYKPEDKVQVVSFQFFGHYNENKVYVRIPTDVLESGKKFKLVMVCDPQAQAQGTTVGEWLLIDGITHDNNIVHVEFR